MRFLRKLRHALVLGLIAGCTSLVHADALFGPQAFTRGPGAPEELVESFEFRGQASAIELIVKNGLPDGTRRISSVWVSLNGVQILDPSDFNQQVTELRREVTLLPANELRIRLGGAPGALLTISVSAVVGPAGGFVVSPAGARLTIPPEAVAGETAIGLREVSLAETGISLPSGYEFLGAVSVELDGRELSAAADLAIPVSQPPAGAAIAARVLALEDLKRLVLVDTAAVGADGLLHTNSPPFPGVCTGGTYLFAQMPSSLGILAVTSQSATGPPAKGALIDILVESVDAATPPATVNLSLQSVSTFIGETDSTGLAAIPGVLPGSSVAVVAMAPPQSTTLQGAVATITVPGLSDFPVHGVAGAWIRNLVFASINIDPALLPSKPPDCPCRALLVNPASITTPGRVFPPGDTQDLRVFCSPEQYDVTHSSGVDLRDLLTGLAVYYTGYLSADSPYASVSSGGRVTAVSPGSTRVYVWTVFARLFKAKLGPVTVISPFVCFASGGVDPVEVSARALVALTGSGSGNVQSAPTGIACPPDCDEYFSPGRSVTLTASPDPDSRFVQWGGDCSGFGTAPTAALTMAADRSCTAEFRLRPRLTVATAGRGTGTVTSQPAGVSCGSNCASRFDEGDVVTLTAREDPGSQFIRWSGDCAGTAASTTITMSSDRSCTAEFEGAIRVVSASYGSGSCRNPVGNVTATAAALCNGRIDCTIFVHNSVFGDPSFGCAKDFTVQWQCGTDPALRSASHGPVAGEGYSVDLTCR